MSFSNYKTIYEVVHEFQIIYQKDNFIHPVPFNIPDYFKEDLDTVLRYGVVDNSESAICENLIYPILKEVWKSYYNHFVLWSHQYLSYLLVEAKQDKFEEGWAQCLAEMIAAQRLNGEITMIIYGIVSNGKSWEFGKIEKNIFTRNIGIYSFSDLDQLFAVVNYIFQQCELQLSQFTKLN